MSDTDKRERSTRRSELTSRARTESEKIQAFRMAERDAVNADRMGIKYFEDKELLSGALSRRRRWEKRLFLSPLATRSDETRPRTFHDRLMNDRRRGASIDPVNIENIHSAILNQRVLNQDTDLKDLRRTKRELVHQLRQLQAMRDLSKSTWQLSQLVKHA